MFLEKRSALAPSIKPASDTSSAAAESIGMFRGGDLASAMIGVIERKTARTRLGRVMFALNVRAEVYQYLVEHPDGATADEIAYALKYSILTVRPRVSDLLKMKRIVDRGSGWRRPNASGRFAKVWIVEPAEELSRCRFHRQIMKTRRCAKSSTGFLILKSSPSCT